MSWNYRVMKHKSEHGDYYGVHEVYYKKKRFGKKNRIWLWSTEPDIVAESVEELGEILKMMLADFENSKDNVLDFDMKPEV